jgi:hypothetical protein
MSMSSNYVITASCYIQYSTIRHATTYYTTCYSIFSIPRRPRRLHCTVLQLPVRQCSNRHPGSETCSPRYSTAHRSRKTYPDLKLKLPSWMSDPHSRWQHRSLALAPVELHDAELHSGDVLGFDATRPSRPLMLRNLRIVFERKRDAVDGQRSHLNVIWCWCGRRRSRRRGEQTLAMRNGVQEP